MSEQELEMTFDPNTIQHLGIKMYSQLPAAIAELVANAYDADASKVYIRLFDDDDGKRISIEDNGHGMLFTEINQRFLRIGRNRRVEDCAKSPKGRIATGKKGLGKLALFGIGNTIEISTKKKGEKDRINFSMSWNDIKDVKGDKPYKPNFKMVASDVNIQGTTISISQLKRNSGFSVSDLSLSLSKIFNFLDNNFRVFISLNNSGETEVTQELRYNSLDKEFSWNFPKFSSSSESEYPKKHLIHGQIITTKGPLKPGQRGITLFANGRMVNAPEFFGSSESSHFFSYTTGWLSVNFVDDYSGEEDLISTNRQSLDWEKDETLQLKIFLQEALTEIHKEWRKKRKEKKQKDIKDTSGIDSEKWYKTIPSEKADVIKKAIEDISDDDSEDDPITILTNTLHALVPEYAQLHWRFLHPTLKEAVEQYYISEDYYNAFFEGVKRYLNTIKTKANTTLFDQTLLEHVFSSKDPKLCVVKKFKKLDGSDFTELTKSNIISGHRNFVIGAWQSCRNPIAHEEVKDLRDSGLFSERDCLDALSLLSHLFYRLDNAEA